MIKVYLIDKDNKSHIIERDAMYLLQVSLIKYCDKYYGFHKVIHGDMYYREINCVEWNIEGE